MERFSGGSIRVWRRSSGLCRPIALLSRIFVPVPSGRGASQGHPCGIAGRETAYVWTGTRTPRGQMPAATRKKKGSLAAVDSAEAVSEETAPAPEGAEEEIVEEELEV